MEKSKTNKKSKSLIVMLVAILLCIAVVLGMGGFTYAKYVSSKSVETQKATVAKWGWTIGLDADDLFVDGYSGGAKVTNPTKDTCDVFIATGSNVVAPGTKGEMTFSISGSAEVRSQIVISATEGTTVQLFTSDDTDNPVYEPIKWTVTKDGAATSVTKGTYSELITYLNGLTNGTTGVTLDPTDTFENAGTYKISWVWVFDENEDTAITSNSQYDTILGALADGTVTSTTDKDGNDIDISNGTATVGENSYTATTEVSLDLSISVTQVQGTSTAG